MPRNSDRIAMKPYLDSVTEICDTLSREELVELILELARDEPTSRRVAFLDRLTSAVPGKTVKIQPQEDLPALFEQVEALEEALIERRDAIEAGEYDLLDDWDWETAGWDDHPEYVSDEQAEDLATFFKIAGTFFISGSISEAAGLYGALFDLLDACAESKYALPEYGLDLKEERARYARCVYDTTGRDERVPAFADVMDLEASLPHRHLEPREGFPMLRDVMETRQNALPDFDAFSEQWRCLLAEKGTGGRPASLLAEIVFMDEGFDGLGKLARDWGNRQPLGYLNWLERLEEVKDPGDTAVVAEEALEILKPGSAREKVSQYLTRAGTRLGNPDRILEGKLQVFYSMLTETNLLRLLDEAVSQGRRDDVLETVFSHFKTNKSAARDERTLLLKIQLMTGRLADAWELVKASETKPVGWSSGLNVGVFFGAAASAMVRHDKKAGAVRKLLGNYAKINPDYGYHEEPETDISVSFYDEIVAGLERSVSREEAVDTYLDWIFLTGRDRVDTIVSNKHRAAYERAAWALVSLAEIHTASGRLDEAGSLLKEYCRVKYNRFSAFKKEVKSVLASSTLLRAHGIGF